MTTILWFLELVFVSDHSTLNRNTRFVYADLTRELYFRYHDAPMQRWEGEDR